MIEKINPYEFNLQGTIELRTVDKTTGQAVETWSSAYSNVWMKRLAPPRGSENQEAFQTVAVQKDSFLIMNEGFTITAKDHRILMGGSYYYIVGVRPFKSSLNYIVLDTEQRDNE
jgi:hypothetical protein